MILFICVFVLVAAFSRGCAGVCGEGECRQQSGCRSSRAVPQAAEVRFLGSVFVILVPNVRVVRGHESGPCADAVDSMQAFARMLHSAPQSGIQGLRCLLQLSRTSAVSGLLVL